MKIGDRVCVKARSNEGDSFYAGRKGIVVKFDPSLGWQTPRALLAPDMFVCVHFFPKSENEKRHGSPIVLISEDNLRLLPKTEK